MPEAKYFAGPAAGLVHQGEKEAVPQPGAGVEDRLRLGGGQDPRQLLRDLERDGPATIGLVLADVVQERLPAAPPAGLPDSQQVTDTSTTPGSLLQLCLV